MEIVKTDVLVLGGGIAGCLAAIKAREYGVDVVLVDKANLGRSGLSHMMSGVLTYFDPDKDDYDTWYKECVEAGQWLNDQTCLDGMINETTTCIRDMERWGVRFQKEKGEFIRKPGVGHIYGGNILMVNGGFQMMSVVRGEVLRRGVRLVERVMTTGLLSSDGELPTKGKVVGAVGFNVITGKFYAFSAKTTIIATGMTSNILLRADAPSLSGDGNAMALKAGCEMRNIDLSISGPHPAGLNCAPGLNILSMEGAFLVNAKGDRIMEKWDSQRMERAIRPIVSRAIATEELEGRGPVYFDATHLDDAAHDRIEKCIPIVIRSVAFSGLDFRKDRIPYTVALGNLSCGGIKVNKERAATIRALYAVGAASDHGEVGAGEYLSPGIASAIGGYRAGEAAAKYSAEVEQTAINERQIQILQKQIFAPLNRDLGLSPREVTQHCKNIIRRGLLGPIKNEKGLNEAIDIAKELREKEIPRLVARDYHELAKCVGLDNALHFLELYPSCSLLRKETRGSHWRSDYPAKDDANWLKWVIAKKDGDCIKVWAEPIPFDNYRIKPKSMKQSNN